jgi:putative ABC transport system permease protein
MEGAMHTFWQDFRYGARTLLRRPGFSLVAIATLALGIGAVTAIFSVIDATLLRPLPFKDPDRLVTVWSMNRQNPLSKMPVSTLDLKDWQRQARNFESFASWFTMDLTLTGGGDATRVKGKGVSGDLFGLLGVTPPIGRAIRDGDHYTVTLSHRLWLRQFNADRQIVGRTITLAGEGYTVVGVAPVGFQFPIEAEPADLWMTWDYAKLVGPMTARDARVAEVIARMRPGVSLAGARAEMETIAFALSQQYPDTNKEIGVLLNLAAEEMTKNHRRPLLVLFGAVSFVLLIVCVNIANLLMVRATARRRELAIRSALGAGPLRIASQLLTESLVLALAGGLLGALAAMWATDAMAAFSPTYLPGIEKIAVNGRVLGFAFLTSLLTGILFGLAPVWQASLIDLTRALKDGAQATDGARGGRLRAALVVSEIALSLILLVGAALLVDSFVRLLRVDPGFDPKNVLSFRISLPYQKYTAVQSGQFFQELQSRLKAIPGVREAANVFPLPMHGDPDFENMSVSLDTRLEIEGRPTPRAERSIVESRTVQPGFVRAMGINVLDGRDFDDRDDAGKPPVAVINQALAEHFFPGENPIGKRLRLSSIVQKDPPMRQIVGVVADIKQQSLDAPARPELYVPFAQDPFQEMYVVIKTEGDSTAVVGAARAAGASLDPEQPIFNIRTLEQRIGLSVSQRRFHTILLSIFSIAALALAAIGLYGVLSYAVALRTHEMGVRLALGAQTSDIIRLILGNGMKLTFAGVGLGLAGAFALTRFLRGLLFGVSATDPWIFAGVALLLTLTALAAVWVPARRATKVDPLEALRQN